MINLEGLPGLLYSRKSRKDIEAEKEAAANGKPYDTLEKHRIALLEMAKKYKLHVVDLFEELVSGEFIAERPKMQKALEMLRSGEIKWVGVMDEDRLGRGDKIDQGRIERAFKESNAYIITPYKIVDLQDEADELYMDYKGMGARYEYKQSKRRLQDGRKRSASRGNYIWTHAPFGYIKGLDFKTNFPHLIQEYEKNASEMPNLKLYPHPEQHQIVRNIFKWFAAGEKMETILDRLVIETVFPWKSSSYNYKNVHRMLKNLVYTGVCVFGKKKYIKLEDGSYKVIPIPKEEWSVTKNTHIPLCSEEDFEKVERRIKEANTAKNKRNTVFRNPLATLLKCHYCGNMMNYAINYSKPRNKHQIICPVLNCKENHSIAYIYVEEQLVKQMKEFYAEVIADPNFITASKQDIIEDLETKVSNLNKLLVKAKKQLANAHDYLEQEIYTLDTFLERQSTISKKIDDLNEQFKQASEDLNAEKIKAAKKNNFVPRLKNVVDTFEHLEFPKDKNDLLKEIIECIYFDKPGPGFRRNPHFNLDITWKDL
ncbi:recombinase family protein [Paenibacillus sp. 11B]|uniref:recombinase family protein n=1 Tax=Paenibacillus sp. 11B TaxID=3060965 RepID=UPI002656ED66|nr:recombinase family protein [Paenibacillus sp. 11B]MDN8590850.1 recombinase family protein [Paenibacillus sp. 11B]